MDTSNNGAIVASYFALMASYVWFRILVFPISIMWSVWVESTSVAGEKIVSWGFMNFGLFTIFLLHMYWFGMIIKIGTYYRQTGQARDLQSNLSSMAGAEKARWRVLIWRTSATRSACEGAEAFGKSRFKMISIL